MIKDPTDDCCTKVLITIVNMCCSMHEGILWYDDGAVGQGWGWTGGGPPGDQTSSWKNVPPSECSKLNCTGAPLRHGKGAGKSGCGASADEVKDCVAKTPAPGKYTSGWRDCRHWASKAKRECGLE